VNRRLCPAAARSGPVWHVCGQMHLPRKSDDPGEGSTVSVVRREVDAARAGRRRPGAGAHFCHSFSRFVLRGRRGRAAPLSALSSCPGPGLPGGCGVWRWVARRSGTEREPLVGTTPSPTAPRPPAAHTVWASEPAFVARAHETLGKESVGEPSSGPALRHNAPKYTNQTDLECCIYNATGVNHDNTAVGRANANAAHMDLT
jgi:hypothetical protein